MLPAVSGRSRPGCANPSLYRRPRMLETISIPAAPGCAAEPSAGFKSNPPGRCELRCLLCEELAPEVERRRRRCMAACVMTADHLAMCAMMAVERLLRGGVCALLCRPNVCGMVLPLRSTCRPLRRPAQSISSGCILSASTAWLASTCEWGDQGCANGQLAAVV